VDVNALTKGGQSALRAAITRGARDVIEVLLAAGADASVVHLDGGNALHAAASAAKGAEGAALLALLLETLTTRGGPDTARRAVLTRNNAGDTPLHAAARAGSAAAMLLLVRAGGDARAASGQGQTAAALFGIRALAPMLRNVFVADAATAAAAAPAAAAPAALPPFAVYLENEVWALLCAAVSRCVRGEHTHARARAMKFQISPPPSVYPGALVSRLLHCCVCVCVCVCVFWECTLCVGADSSAVCRRCRM
jgi:hypothetical protein